MGSTREFIGKILSPLSRGEREARVASQVNDRDLKNRPKGRAALSRPPSSSLQLCSDVYFQPTGGARFRAPVRTEEMRNGFAFLQLVYNERVATQLNLNYKARKTLP
jgi:hypothetical protein